MTAALPRTRVRSRAGRCFELCSKAVLSTREWVVVHGTVRSRLVGRIAHAWLRSGDRIYDPVLDREYSLADYCRTFDACPVVEYDSAAAAAEMVTHRHYGPWLALDAQEPRA
jgi:hypothetical protein